MQFHKYSKILGFRNYYSVPPSFSRSYPDAEFKIITRDNYYEFLL